MHPAALTLHGPRNHLQFKILSPRLHRERQLRRDGSKLLRDNDYRNTAPTSATHVYLGDSGKYELQDGLLVYCLEKPKACFLETNRLPAVVTKVIT